MIGIIGAMGIEVEGLKQKMTLSRTDSASGILFYVGALHGTEVVVAVSGVGKVNAAVCAQTMILHYQPELVINTGVAGGIGEGIGIFDVVWATAVVQHDMNTVPLGEKPGLLRVRGAGLVELPCRAMPGDAWAEALRGQGISLKTGLVASGDQFIDDEKDVRRISEQFGADAVDMESGAIAQVCCINETECCIVRTISDSGDGMEFTQFVARAAEISIAVIEAVLSAQRT